jgi:hypothetical protein
MRLSDLHDAMLESLDLDWNSALLQLSLRTGILGFEEILIQASGTTDLSCPRQMPWGPSNSVNSASLETLPTGIKLTIEMQSGDLIEVSCESVELRSL